MSRLLVPALVLISVITGVLIGAFLGIQVMHEGTVNIGGDALLAGGTFVMAALMFIFLWGQNREITELRECVAKIEV